MARREKGGAKLHQITGVRKTKDPKLISSLIKSGKVVISELIIGEASHECLKGIHVYVIGEKNRRFLAERFPQWIPCCDHDEKAPAFCVREGSLRNITEFISSALKGA